MKPSRTLILAGLLGGLALSGCQQKAAPKFQPPPTVFRLFDLFRPDDLTGKVTPADAAWRRFEWQAQDMTPWIPSLKTETGNTSQPAPASASPIGFRARNDIGELKIDRGKLVGDLTGPRPILDFALKDNRGGAEPVKFIEVRMSVSGAKYLWLRPEEGPAVDDTAMLKWAGEPKSMHTPVYVTEGRLQTYRFEIQPGPDPAAEPAAPGSATAGLLPQLMAAAGFTPTTGARPPGTASGDFRHFLIAFRECNSGRFSIESVRFVTEQEEKLKEPSGQQWAGLGHVYRATLAAKTPESIRIPLRELPKAAFLELATGTPDDAPVKFTVSVANQDSSKATAPKVVFERTVAVRNQWGPARIDLAAFAGKPVTIQLSLAAEKKGLWGYWGSPVIRGRLEALPSQPATGGAQVRRSPRGVIFLLVDALRKDHLNIYGYPRQTVIHLKQFADEGVAFNHAISQATTTVISVPSIVTSLYPLTHTVLGFESRLPASAKTIAEVFREAGYNTVAYSSVAFTGKMNNLQQGYDELHELLSIPDNEYPTKTARQYVDRTITWLQQHRDTPFFVFLHVFDPHSPFRPRPPYDTIWGSPGSRQRLTELEVDMKKSPVRASFGLPFKEDYLKTGHDPDELLKIYTDWYDGSIRGVDDEVGRLLEALRGMGLDQDTLMVLAADHGEEFWEHGRFFHGHGVYGEQNQVPMVYRWPNSPDLRKGVMLDQQVQNIDIMPTLLELAGIQGPTNMQGRSLVPLLNGSGIATWQERPAIAQAMVNIGTPRKSHFVPHFGIIDHGWKLVRKEVDAEVQQELYEHPIDHLNLTNVIRSEGPASHVRPLNETLAAWKTQARAAQLPGDETTAQQISSEELRRLRALGYLGDGASSRLGTGADKEDGGR